MANQQIKNDTTKGSISFIENRIPELLDGDYTLSMWQALDIGNVADQHKFYHFSIAGPRFSLSPTEIKQSFPAPNSIGDFSHVFPHIILKRSTLPWERAAVENSTSSSPKPWLGLVVLDQEEMDSHVEIGNMKRSEFREKPLIASQFPVETGEDPDQQLKVMTVSNELFTEIYPRLNDLRLLAHIRQAKNDIGSSISEEFAVIVGNRLPKPHSRTHVFLVSFENAFDQNGNLISLDEAETNLPVLFSWNFETGAETNESSFSGTLAHLAETDLSIQLENVPDESYTNQAGFLILPHTFRNGDKSASFYRGPLAIPQTTVEFQFPVMNSDSLLAYDLNLGMFVAAYAAAWELGKLLALKDKSFSSNLYEWKRKQMLLNKSATQALEKDHLPIYGKSKVWNNLMNEQLAFFRLNREDETNRVDNSRQIGKGGKEQYARNNTFADSLKFDGTSTFVNANSVISGLGESFTLSFWIQNQGWNEGSGEERNIVSYLDTSISTSEISLRILENTIQLYSSSNSETSSLIDTTVEWMHIAIVHKVEEEMVNLSVYLNGEKEISASIERNSYNSLTFGKVGTENDLPSYVGEISNLRLFNRNVIERELDLIRKADLQASTIYPFFNKLRLLEGVPFNYLIPNENQFATESVSFSKIDSTWMQSLLDGAFSIGRSSALRLEEDEYILREMGINSERDYSALMIRSSSLQSWKDAMIEGYSTSSSNTETMEGNRLTILRKEMLSDHFLICIFEGMVETVDISQKGETIHFGVDASDNGYAVSLRNSDGIVQESTAEIAFHNTELKVMNCDETQQNIASFDAELGFSTIGSSQFALELIEGVQKVRFTNAQNQ